MQRSATRPYAGLRCLASRPSGAAVLSRWRRVQELQPARVLSQTSSRKIVVFRFTDGGAQGEPLDDPGLPSSVESDVRARLRTWEAENGAAAEPTLQDDDETGDVLNALTRPRFHRPHRDIAGWLDSAAGLSGLEDVEADGVGGLLRIGDLVAIRMPGQRTPVLVIHLGSHANAEWAFTNDHGLVRRTAPVAFDFRVPGFVDPEGLKPLLAEIKELPDVDTEPPQVVFGRLNLVGEELFAKMRAFLAKSDAVYRANTSVLDRAWHSLSHDDQSRYLTLAEIADRLLAGSSKVDGKHTAEALFTVYRTINSDEHVFSSPEPVKGVSDATYEVRSLKDISIIRHMEAMVHHLMERSGNSSSQDNSMQQSSLDRFILRARRVIEASRQRRQWSPYGMIGPEKQTHSASLGFSEWNKDDLDVIRFLELWATGRFSVRSHINSIGSRLVRYLGMYGEAEVALGNDVGFTVLQELGWFAPWEILSRFALNNPGLTGSRDGGLMERPGFSPERLHESLMDDIARGYRKDWGDSRVYVIDSADTTTHDDGISVEATNTPGEYWIHAHIADPGSRIRPGSPLAKSMEEMCQSSYVPWQSFDLLPESLLEELSLADGSPCLTFSGLVNEAGELLDYTIQPGTVRNVIRTTHEDVIEHIPRLEKTRTHVSNPDGFTLEVGKRPDEEMRPRVPIVSLESLSATEKEDLAILARLAQGRRRRRDENSLPLNQLSFLRPSVQVSFQGVSQQPEKSSPDKPTIWHGDPYIKVQLAEPEDDYLVEEVMVLAGEVAARWCSDRGVPVPYVTAPEAQRNFGQIRRYLEDVVLPAVREGLPYSMIPRHTISSLLGASVRSPDPSPHPFVGLDMYTKATSPLRRYLDLVVHWQVHGALAAERAPNGPAGAGAGAGEDGPAASPPFSRAEVAAVGADQAGRAGRAVLLERRWGLAAWVRQACLRAWFFGEAALPRTLTFTADGAHDGRTVAGAVDLFESRAWMGVDDLGGVARVRDVEPGDRFEVKVTQILPSSRLPLRVRAVRRLAEGEVLDAGRSAATGKALRSLEENADLAAKLQDAVRP